MFHLVDTATVYDPAELIVRKATYGPFVWIEMFHSAAHQGVAMTLTKKQAQQLAEQLQKQLEEIPNNG